MQKERIRNGGVRVRSLAAGLAASFAVAGLVAVMPIRGMNQAPAAAATAADSASSSKGTFENVCAACHGIDGHGGERGPDIASRAETLQKTDSELLVILKEGRTAKGMPGFAAYGDDRLKALVDYLRVLQGRTKEASPGDAVAGKAVFYGKGKCADCHMVGGKGGFFASDLTGYTAGGKSVSKIRAAIVSPDKALDPRRGLVTAVRKDGTTISGLARNEDNFSLQLQTTDGAFHLLNKTDITSQRYEGRSGMPADYGSKLKAREVDDLVSFLMRSAAAANAHNGEGEWHDGDDE
ncbi:MAG TPA: c-type cytochrome [Candidatus Acidoferrum sp.]|nr:c-type cytochrome [Candidatus Acidoferrum sp.]